MASISLKNINKVYISKKEQFKAVSDFNLEIKDKEFVVLVGPSGCGKSTTLRMIAGLEDITSGELKIGKRKVNDVQPKDRDIAMVFQNYSLYPHMNVYQNMAFSLTMRKMARADIERHVREAAKILDIEHLLKRKPKALSGGQRQRVALGRAIVRKPKVFLLDEPLSNLDAKLRTQMRAEISKLHNRVGTTFVYVTHDQTEAMTMADRIVVMKDGIIQQVDNPENLYNYPKNLFVAGFIGSPQMNFIEGTLNKKGNDFAVDTRGGSILLPKSKNEKGALDKNIGGNVTVGIRPEDVAECPDGKKPNTFSAPIEISEMMGAEILVYFEFAGSKIIAKFPASSDVRKRDTVRFCLDAEKAHIFESETGNIITN